MKFFILILLFITGCSKANVDEKAGNLDRLQELKDAYAKKINEAKENFDKKTGWPSAKDCDGTLWAGLASAGGVDTIQLDSAEYEPGEIHRRPKSSGDCYPGESASTVSRDMVIGYLFGQWNSRNIESVRRFIERSESRNWVIGEPWPERAGELLLTGNMIGLLGRMACELYGKCKIYRKIPPIHSKSGTDYVQHLTVIYILLDGQIDNKVGFDDSVRLRYPMETTTTDIKESEKEVLKWHKEASPNDALFNAAWHLYEDGDFNEASNMLLDSYTPPSYTRGDKNNALVNWIFTAKMILIHY